MEVIILAGGLGTRLRSVVNKMPKCMAPIENKPFLWYLLKYISRYRVSKVVMSVGYMRDAIINWIDNNRAEFPFSFDYAIEVEPMGTGGAIKWALKNTTQNDVIVLNGDTFFNVDLNALYETHRLYLSSVTLALKPMKEFDRYGNVQINKINNRIIAFEEKKYCDEGLINGGVYIINKQELPFDNLPQKFSFETEILQPQCKFGKLYGVVQHGYFIDIGIPEDYKRACQELPKIFF